MKLFFTCLQAPAPPTLPASQTKVPDWLPDTMMSHDGNDEMFDGWPEGLGIVRGRRYWPGSVAGGVSVLNRVRVVIASLYQNARPSG
jgi:hypothetical protein